MSQVQTEVTKILKSRRVFQKEGTIRIQKEFQKVFQPPACPVGLGRILNNRQCHISLEFFISDLIFTISVNFGTMILRSSKSHSLIESFANDCKLSKHTLYIDTESVY